MGKLGFKEGEGLPRFPCRQKEKEKKIILSLRRISRSPPSFLSPPPPLPTYRCSVISLSLSLSISFREFPEVSRVGCRGFRLECRCRHSTLASCLALPLFLPSPHGLPRPIAPSLSWYRSLASSRSLALSLSRSTHAFPAPSVAAASWYRSLAGFAVSALMLSLKSRFLLGNHSLSDFWLSAAVPFLSGQNSTFK